MDNAPTTPRIGIALSGGGSRAIAYHLGCLRALDRTGVLTRARVLSTVSGGSVIGALYASHVGPFEAFEAKVRAMLAEGLVRPALVKTVTSAEGLKAATAFILHLLAWVLAWPPGLVARLLGGRRAQEPPRRRASRTTILRRTLDDRLFHGAKLTDLPERLPRLMIVAAELRTSSAFYFGRRSAGGWRLGRIDPAQIPLAHAVTASAAYPLALPALDDEYAFARSDGSLRTERVTLSDGGVYDNLGLSPLWPDRDRAVSLEVEPIDFIVACRAGYGLRMNAPSLFFKARMGAAFACVHMRAQNATMKRLFDLKEAGRLEGFALSYIDQDDARLACVPADLVPRASVADYPTNFDAMTPDWIERLSRRGDQVTMATLRDDADQLLPARWRAAAGTPSPSADEDRVP